MCKEVFIVQLRNAVLAVGVKRSALTAASREMQNVGRESGSDRASRISATRKLFRYKQSWYALKITWKSTCQSRWAADVGTAVPICFEIPPGDPVNPPGDPA